ncbi:type II restriction endonuclease [Rahnella bonaserana]|uniref:type II restriction endonuclease n=1 Tax=Rahnella bonaserana TaxID=2816248 RepID=UPI0024C386B4|nr:type II restriction endonuclease [Rahnella bonaserana]WHZ40200.1 type II restriction endonuclease [Rahnella bonaserana]
MFEKLSDYFEGAVGKYLTAVDADPKKSNQHEIGGLIKAGFGQHLGLPKDGEALFFKTTMIYISDEDAEPISCDMTSTWYDTRFNDPTRGAEFRLYYQTNTVSTLMAEGDFFLIIKRKDGSLIMVITPSSSSVEQQLAALFNITITKNGFAKAEINQQQIVLPIRMLFESIGIEIEEPESRSQDLLALLLDHFPAGFPKAKEFSQLARDLIPGDPHNEPDTTLMLWLEQEEKLFRTYERFEVAKKLQSGFGEERNDVDDFIQFSLSVQNRRKARVGFAFENHLNKIFTLHNLNFEQGSSKLTTENKAKPDFLFPSFSAYHDISFPVENLRLLGAKTTCKDRWRQVLAEGDRVIKKHLVTIQAGISESQLSEMKNKSLQLVVPSSVQVSYPSAHIPDLQNLKDFILEIKSCQ